MRHGFFSSQNKKWKATGVKIASEWSSVNKRRAFPAFRSLGGRGFSSGRRRRQERLQPPKQRWLQFFARFGRGPSRELLFKGLSHCGEKCPVLHDGRSSRLRARAQYHDHQIRAAVDIHVLAKDSNGLKRTLEYRIAFWHRPPKIAIVHHLPAHLFWRPGFVKPTGRHGALAVDHAVGQHEQSEPPEVAQRCRNSASAPAHPIRRFEPPLRIVFHAPARPDFLR